MNRGRNYHQTPMARIRPTYRRWLFLFVLLLLIVSAVKLAIYFTNSYQNSKAQTLLADQHQALQSSAAANNGVAEQPAKETTADSSVLSADKAALDARVAMNNNQPETEMANKAFFNVTGPIQESMKPFVKQNKDTVGWIQIEGVLDLPFVYRDNTYYLTHDFYGKQNISGAVFLDMNNPLQADSQNLLLWGHNMKDGSMFGRLSKYLHDNYLHSHNIIQLETRQESFVYIIFAVNMVVMDVNAKDYLPFWMHPTFQNEESFDAYIDTVFEQSLYTRYLDVNYSDTLLTLATCNNEERLVLIARRQREEETDASIQLARLGLYPK